MRSRGADGAINFVSLFAGGGGLHLGLEQAGLNCLFATDIEPSSEKTFRLNRPDLPFLRTDVQHLTQSEVTRLTQGKKIHLVAGGPPCQGFSTLGDQNISDPRNFLFWSFLKVVKWLQPDCFLMENVNYLRSQYNGKFEREILQAFSGIGYSVDVHTLNAADFGVPQIRKRVFFFGTRLQRAFKWPAASHGDGLRPQVSVRAAIADLSPVDQHWSAANHTPLRHGEKVIARYKLIPEGGRMPPPQDLPPDIRRRNFGNTYKRLSWSKPSLTLVPGNNAFPVHPEEHRSLTPREAARLQTFPDQWIFCGTRAEQCKLVGNAVPVLLGMRLGEAVARHLASRGLTKTMSKKEASLTTSQLEHPAAVRQKASTGMKAVSFFTGAGGLLLGFANAGFEVIASYDKKNIVAKNHPINFPEIPHFQSDLSAITPEQVRLHTEGKTVDVVFGGPPCQGFSIFGKRRFINTKGHQVEADERNELSIHYIDLAISLSPKAILMENVKGFVSAPRGDRTYLDVVKAKLATAGYSSEWKIVNCADYGVPQLRERFILVAWKEGLKFQWPEIKFFKEAKSWQRRYVTVGDVITDLMDDVTHSPEFSHVPMAHKELVVERYKLIPEGGRLPEGTIPEALLKGYRTDKVKNYSHVYKRLSMSAPATTMVPGHNAFPLHPKLHRALTVREAARIQTFPDYMRFVGTRQQQCLLVGNAVPPLLSELFAQCIMKTIRGNFSDPGFKQDIYELRALG